MTTLFNMCLGPEDMEEMLQRKPPTFGPQPLPAHIFNYHQCRTWELRKFLQDRKLSIEFVSREHAIRELQKADAIVTFRILDLPPELRNHIYRIALALKDVEHLVGPVLLGTQPKCTPEILATSKQVYAEARNFLYAENDFVITLAADTAVHKPGRYQLKCEVCGLRPSAWDGMYMMGMGGPMTLEKRSLDWPEFVRRAEKLIIRIDLPMPPSFFSSDLVRVTDSAFYGVNRALYDLSCFLTAKSDVKQALFDISCEVDKFILPQAVVDMLSPIRLFPAKKTFKIRLLTSSIADSIKDPVERNVHMTGELSTVHAFRGLVREATLLEEIPKSAQNGSRLDMDRVREFREQGRRALGVKDNEHDVLITPDMHRKLVEAVQELNSELSSSTMPGYEGEDQEVVKKLERLQAVRKMFGR